MTRAPVPGRQAAGMAGVEGHRQVQGIVQADRVELFLLPGPIGLGLDVLGLHRGSGPEDNDAPGLFQRLLNRPVEGFPRAQVLQVPPDREPRYLQRPGEPLRLGPVRPRVADEDVSHTPEDLPVLLPAAPSARGPVPRFYSSGCTLGCRRRRHQASPFRPRGTSGRIRYVMSIETSALRKQGCRSAAPSVPGCPG
jgi:hypothetical protein